MTAQIVRAVGFGAARRQVRRAAVATGSALMVVVMMLCMLGVAVAHLDGLFGDDASTCTFMISGIRAT